MLLTVSINIVKIFIFNKVIVICSKEETSMTLAPTPKQKV